MKNNFILEISFFYQDISAVLIRDSEIISAVQEERFFRKKHDSRFPKNAIKYCLNTNNLDLWELPEGIAITTKIRWSQGDLNPWPPACHAVAKRLANTGYYRVYDSILT